MQPDPPDPLVTHPPNPLVAHRTPGRSTLRLTRPGGEHIGEMVIQDPGADILLNGLSATLERDDHFRYRMLAGIEELLSAAPSGRGVERLSIHHAEDTYEARVSPLRNTATVHSDVGGEIARVSGGLLGLKYRVSFDAGDLSGPLVALLVLYHLLLVRSRAYRAIPAHLTPGGL